VLEIKNHIEEEDINRLVNNVRELGWLERTIFISFDLDNLIAVRKLLPNQPIQFLTDKMDQKVLDILNKYRFDLDVKYTGISQSQIKRLRSQGINVNVWTVDDPQVAKTMAGYGVNYITTNILE
jgi:glycerophosphoryl diester phosphodiesterase